MKRGVGLVALALSGCIAPNEGYQPANRAPMTLPPADGRPFTVTRDSFDYGISRLNTAHGFELRVTRHGRDLDYSEGATAKKAVQAYCAGFNRGFSASAMGRFSVPNSWVFDGDCA